MPAGVHGSGPGRAHHEAAEVDRVQAVDVLVGVDGEQRRLLVEAARAAGPGPDRRATAGSALNRRDDRLELVLARSSAGRCSWTEAMPTSAQSSCFMAT